MNKELLPFLNYKYEQGIQDCFSLVREYYQTKYQLEIRNYARPDKWYVNSELDFFNQKFEAEGFFDTGYSAHKVRHGDVLLMFLGRSEVVNHVAIYVGRNKILHHLEGKLSGLDEYNDKWRYRVSRVLRHPEVELAIDSVTLSNLHQGLPLHIRKKLRG